MFIPIFLAPKHFKNVWLSNLSILSVRIKVIPETRQYTGRRVGKNLALGERLKNYVCFIN
jgi:hypothetical protein